LDNRRVRGIAPTTSAPPHDDRAIDSTAAEQRRVRRIDDGIDALLRDVALSYLDAICVHAEFVRLTPNPKIQIPTRARECRKQRLVFGVWNLFGFWDLDFGVFSRPIQMLL
jgi:hypothetical protein